MVLFRSGTYFLAGIWYFLWNGQNDLVCSIFKLVRNKSVSVPAKVEEWKISFVLADVIQYWLPCIKFTNWYSKPVMNMIGGLKPRDGPRLGPKGARPLPRSKIFLQSFYISFLYLAPFSPINLANSIQIATTQLKLKYLNCLSMIGVTHQFVSSIVVTLLFLYIVKHLFFIKC